jgi:hypothetical protein
VEAGAGVRGLEKGCSGLENTVLMVRSGLGIAVLIVMGLMRVDLKIW